MSQASSREQRPAIEVELSIDQCCGRFEGAWAAGAVPDIQAALDAAALGGDDLDARRMLLVELALIDIEYRWRAERQSQTERWRVEDYLTRWPELVDAAGNPPVELVRQEFRVRRLAGEQPDRAEYAARFAGLDDIDAALTIVERRTPAWMRSLGRRSRQGESAAASAGLSVRCPHCRDAVTVVADSSLADIACQSCGRRFSLVGDGERDNRPPLASVAHFEFLERLGVGGFGTVWRARDTRLDRLVAVKIPRKGYLNSAEAQQFLREARSAAQLRHPHIVSVHEVGREGDTIYIVSDYVAGEPLSKRLEAGPLPQREAAALAAKLADALAHAHGMGVVHRDLKPANVMLDEAGEPHVMDFGLAKRDAGEMTMTVDGNILGTPAYMPPEQARGEGHRADRRSDVYSLGVVLFEMLTGELPFRGSTQMLIAQILAEEPPSPRHLDRNISRDLETICLKCLEKEPARRYQTAGELAEELRRFLRGEPIVARPVGGLERGVRWCRRRPLVAGLGGTLAAVVLAVAIVAPIIAAHQSKLRSDAETLAGQLDVSLGEQRKQTATANRLRGEAENLNIGLQKAIEEKDRQFRRANALRLAAQAKSIVEESPQVAVLLAAAALESSRELGESTVEARQALYDVLAEVSGIGTTAHPAPITAVDASRDGRWCASGDRAGNVRLWRCAALAQRATAAGPATVGGESLRRQRGSTASSAKGFASYNSVMSMAFDKDVVDVRFSRDGRHLVAAAGDGVVRAFDIVGENVELPPRQWRCDAALRAIDLGGNESSDGMVAAACDDGRVRLWTLADESGASPRLLAASEGALRSVAIQPGGVRIAAAGDDRKVYVWNTPEATEEETGKAAELAGHDDVIQLVRFSPDGRWLASCGNDRTARLWRMEALHGGGDDGGGDDRDVPHNFAAAAAVLIEGHGGAIRDAAFSLDGQLIATASSDGVVRVWQQRPSDATWQLRTALSGHRSIVRAIAFSADGKRLVSASEDFTARVWKLDAASPERSSVVLRGHERAIVDAALIGSGRRLVTGGVDGSLRFYDDVDSAGAGAAARVRHSTAVRGVCFIGAGSQRLATGTFDGGLQVWSPRGADEDRMLALENIHAAAIPKLAASAVGRLLVATCADGRASLWGAAGGDANAATPRLAEHGEHVADVVFHADCERFVTACYDGVLRSWSAGGDAPLEAVVMRKGRRPLLAVAVDPLGRWAAAGDERGVVTFAPFDAAAKEVPEPLLGRTMLTALAVSPDGRRLFTGDFQGTIRQWDLRAGGASARPVVVGGHEKAVTSLSVSSDGRTLLSASPDGTARLWDLTSPTPAATGVVLRGHGAAVFAGAISSDAHYAATACDDRFARLWPIDTAELLAHARRIAGRALTEEERRTFQLDADQER